MTFENSPDIIETSQTELPTSSCATNFHCFVAFLGDSLVDMRGRKKSECQHWRGTKNILNLAFKKPMAKIKYLGINHTVQKLT
jgi:hypothetical protein